MLRHLAGNTLRSRISFFPRFYCNKPLKSPLVPENLIVSYLVSTCGLSLTDATAAVSRRKLPRFGSTSSARADAVVSLLRSYGFSDDDVTIFSFKKPSLLFFSSDILRPKLDFLVEIGITGPDLVKLLCADPTILSVSLSKRLIPNYNLVRSIFATDEEFRTALRGTTRLLQSNLNTAVMPNLQALKNHGFPGPHITKLAMQYPRVLMMNHRRFDENIGKLKDLGFDPSSRMFMLAIVAMSGLHSSTWDRKVKLYLSMGWSYEDVMVAFRKDPFCMLNSDDKIHRIVSFFINEVGWEPSLVAMRSKLIRRSFEGRIVPRWRIYNVLHSKGVVLKVGLSSLLLMTERNLLEKYVMKYEDEFPEIREIYEASMGKKKKKEKGAELREV